MALIFVSKLYREQIKHWALLVVLFIWGTIATTFAFSNRRQVIVIGIDESGARIVTNSTDRLLKQELILFLKEFFSSYYNYDEKTYSQQMGKATDLMTSNLFEKEKDNFLKIQKNLLSSPLSQSAEILSIDLVGEGRAEAMLELSIHSKMSMQKIKLKVNLEFRKRERTETLPWAYEITGVSDVSI